MPPPSSSCSAWLRGWRPLAATLRRGGPTLWLSGACWAVMFTAFMVAITMTTVANVLVTMAIAPLAHRRWSRGSRSAIACRRAPGRRCVVAGAGIAWMYANEVAAADVAPSRRHRRRARRADRRGDQLDRDPEERPRRRRPAAGGADRRRRLLPGDRRCRRFRFTATGSDLALLGLLGVAQLAIPCLIAVAAARAPERSRSGPAVAARDRVRRDLDLARRRRGAGPARAGRRRPGDRRAGRQRGAGAAPGAMSGSDAVAAATAKIRARSAAGRKSSRYHAARFPVAHRMPRSRPFHAAPKKSERPRPPGPLLMLLEGRAPLEYVSMLAAFPWLRRLPRGDGHPVMVFPGLGANDATTWPLRRFLRSLGYVTQAWGQGFNFGPRVGVLERCAADLRALAERTGQPVSLIGWSLGGIYAREMAKAASGASRAASSRSARRSPAIRAPPTPGGSTSGSAAQRVGDPAMMDAAARARRRCRRPRSSRAATASSPGAAA